MNPEEKHILNISRIQKRYDKEYGEVITFESNAIMNDSNDIITEAIRLMLFEEEYRNKVRWAHCVSEYEYEYIEKGRR